MCTVQRYLSLPRDARCFTYQTHQYIPKPNMIQYIYYASILGTAFCLSVALSVLAVSEC